MLWQVPVCVAGKGPYDFVLDTGAPASLISSRLATQLGLASATARQEALTVGCTSTTRQVRVGSWSLDGLPLSPQAVLTANLPGLGKAGEPAGVIGSDVLSRFGAIRVDFAKRQLTVLASEAASPSIANVLQGKAGAAPPPLLVLRTPQAAAMLTVVRSNGTALATTDATFGGHGPYRLTVDTGSAESSVTTAVAKSLSLKSSGSVANTVAGCHGKVAQVGSGAWSIGTVRQPPARLMSENLTGTDQRGLSGRLGSGVLAAYGSVVLDYRTAVLWLGAG